MLEETRVAEESEATPETKHQGMHNRQLWKPVMSVSEFVELQGYIDELVKQGALKQGTDYGALDDRREGDKRLVLFKAGAEKIARFFGLVPDYSLVSKTEHWPIDGAEAIFAFHYKCKLYRETGEKAGEGEGECNSLEIKYRWRWVKKEDLGKYGNPPVNATRSASRTELIFGIDKARAGNYETTGKYGKPKAYWDEFLAAIDNGTAKKGKFKAKDGREWDCYEMGGEECRILNPDAPDLRNTLVKMAKKRAHVDAVISTLGLSEHFTQDINDPETDDDAPPAQNHPPEEYDQRPSAQEQAEKPKAEPKAKAEENPKAEARPGVLAAKAMTAIAKEDSVTQKDLGAAIGNTLGVVNVKESVKADKALMAKYVKLLQKLAGMDTADLVLWITVNNPEAEEPKPAAAPPPPTPKPEPPADEITIEEFAALEPVEMLKALQKKGGVPYGIVHQYFAATYNLTRIPGAQNDEFKDAAQEAINLFGYSPADVKTALSVTPEAK
jgi:hypothetical protein